MNSTQFPMRVFRTPFILPWLYPSLVWREGAASNKIYLTFDDGPVPGPTEFVLDTLQRHNLKATFFCIGDNVRKYPQVFDRVLQAGHAIGNHTYHHIKGWNVSVADYFHEVQLCQAQFHLHGCRTQLFRPPYGRITRAQIGALREFKIVMWDVLTYDYDASVTGPASLRGSLRAVRPGSVIVMHDSLKAEKNLRFVLPRLIGSLQQRGYQFDALA